MTSDGTERSTPPPRTLGPYRVEERLGAGGMGEVFRGYDDRLDRPVALKRIKPGGEDSEATRARFRREARAAARLSHGAVVQVYDWVEGNDADWIVMELIDGRPLRRVMADDTPPLETTLRFTRQIAGALQAAHSTGIVHRDLKADNVMVTGDGEVKVLDFGLAKRYDNGGAAPTELSAHGQIVGTVSGMSPEQALGKPLDGRSDLFSFGSLLYELLTGVSPFRGQNAAETLTRICTAQQLPVHRQRPDVPAALSDLVDRLLEKDPGRRPKSAGAVVAILESFGARPDPSQSGEAGTSAAGASEDQPSDLDASTRIAGRLEPEGVDDPTPALPRPAVDPATVDQAAIEPEPMAAHRPQRRGWLVAVAGIVLALLGLVAWHLAKPDRKASPERLYVAVAAPRVPESVVQDPAVRLLAGTVRAGVERGLLGLSGLGVLDGGRASDTDPLAIASDLGADEVLTSELDCALETCQIVLRRRRGADGAVLWLGRMSIDRIGADLPAYSSRIAEQVRGGYPDREAQGALPDLRVSTADFATFLELEHGYLTRERSAESDEFLAQAMALQAQAPRFLEPILLEVTIRRLRFLASRRDEERELGTAAVERALALAPEDPRVLRAAAQMAIDSGRLEDAEALLETADRLEPGDVGWKMRRAALLERQGRLEEAREVLASAAHRRPTWRNLTRLADLDYRTGDVQAARRNLEAALERAPGNFDVLSRLAQLELLNGDPRRAAELYEKLVERAPEATELTNLGVAHLLLADYGAAVRRFRQVLEATPDSPYALLNLADAELLRGEAEQARDLYQRVLERVEADPDPEALRMVRAQAEGHLGRVEAAVGSAQQALRRAPDNPQVIYEAALVHALAGDAASALFHSRRALELGIDQRWFGFPWFDSIRDRL
ncbi:MAG: protein kinase [Acidobacteriota bacterium]